MVDSEGDSATIDNQRIGAVMPFPATRSRIRPDVSFDRQELREIMNVYGRGVAEGAWKDYALDFTPDKAVLSIYRRASEVPMFRVEKTPALARKQGAYAVLNATGFVLKRGPELARVLRAIDPRPKLSLV
jgi:hypothetical protein